MIQTCSEEYWANMPKLRPKNGPCGKTFDDRDHYTFCPHDYFPPAIPFFTESDDPGYEPPPPVDASKHEIKFVLADGYVSLEVICKDTSINKACYVKGSNQDCAATISAQELGVEMIKSNDRVELASFNAAYNWTGYGEDYEDEFIIESKRS